MKSCADLRRADLRGANLECADLRGADLRGANLRCADLDFSCLPLWCGSLSAHFDDNQIIQIVYHAVKAGLNSKNVSEEVKVELSKVIGLANRFHRAEECGRIETEAIIELNRCKVSGYMPTDWHRRCLAIELAKAALERLEAEKSAE